MIPDISIRPLSLNEMNIPIDWAAAEGWNPGLNDASAFHAADPHGFLVAFVGHEPAACISVVRSGATFGFLGFYICRPDMRGKGIGWRLWQAGMAHLDGRTVGLDGVVAQQENYRKSGFALAHRNIRFSGIPAVSATAEQGIVVITADMAERITAYDAPFYPGDRAAFLKLWLALPESHAVACIRDGEIHGYGVIRRCQSGRKIGPLFAETPDIADRLFVALAATAPGEAIVLDTPEPNTSAVALAERHGLSPVFETARMYRGPRPDLPLSRIFGITTFELG
jgi:GNAT superfamily N-acetyltransferase